MVRNENSEFSKKPDRRNRNNKDKIDPNKKRRNRKRNVTSTKKSGTKPILGEAARVRGSESEMIVCNILDDLKNWGMIKDYELSESNSLTDCLGIDITLLDNDENYHYIQVKSSKESTIKFRKEAARKNSRYVENIICVNARNNPKHTRNYIMRKITEHETKEAYEDE